MKYQVVGVCAVVLGCTAFAAEVPKMTVPESLAVQLKPFCSTADDMKAVADIGMKFVRRGFYWEGVEKEKGVYNFEAYDKLLADADKQGLRVVGCLFGGNKKYEDTGYGGVTTEEGRAGFAAFAAALAARYKDRNIIWEIWNEPNVRTFWRKNGVHNTPEFAQEYTDLVKATAPAMVKADPKCIVLAGSLSNYWQPSYNWTEKCFELGILKTGIKGWSVHPYGVKTPEMHAIGHAEMRRLMKKYGAENFPMYNTERGYATQAKKGHEGELKGKAELQKEYQAWYFVRQYMIDLMWDVKLSVWYEWKDPAGEFTMIEKGQPRPICKSAKVMVEQLRGYDYVKRIPLESDLDYVLLFKNARGNQKLVCWTTPPDKPRKATEEKPSEASSGQAPKPPAKEGEDATVTHLITLPVAVKKAAGADVYGKVIPVQMNAGKAQVEISGAPVYVALD